jgi:hypothetical protein
MEEQTLLGHPGPRSPRKLVGFVVVLSVLLTGSIIAIIAMGARLRTLEQNQNGSPLPPPPVHHPVVCNTTFDVSFNFFPFFLRHEELSSKVYLASTTSSVLHFDTLMVSIRKVTPLTTIMAFSGLFRRNTTEATIFL